ncbi:secretion protein HlyD [Methylobacterium sp. Leaf469]|uniref:HlyD family efflux transporter periplasmic adaptor subunit n=1 Tax=unclassified Methylobacterium TaxID=2615210 RepID=UPI0006FB0426|nr:MULTISPECIES: HlyD family efflux transporter periplasmic adaptor subunit [unclassified Methylobacterium]KQO63375.1 secretion protein HlyD [Methylobacterium sp. Leaf87]KQT86780.1 secretion protein HlyD [Methylobacterium sp. Leaf469]
MTFDVTRAGPPEDDTTQSPARSVEAAAARHMVRAESDARPVDDDPPEAQPEETSGNPDDGPMPGIVQNPRIVQTIDLRQNRTATLATGLVALTVCTVIGGLWFGHFAQTETVRGTVAATGGFARLDAPRAGVITRIFLNQGDPVKAGQAVYALRIGSASSGGESAVEAEMRNLQLSRKGLQDEVERADAFIARATKQQAQIAADQEVFYAGLAEQAQRHAAATEKSRAVVRRIAAYMRDGYATRDMLESHERGTFDLERQLSDLRLKRLEVQRQDSERRREFDLLVATKVSQKASAQNQIESTDSRLAMLRTETAVEVQAQSAGAVLALAAKVGDSVKPGQFVAATGEPNAAPLVVVEAPARAVGLAKVGQRVIIKYDAFPFKTFGIQHGTITYISTAAVRGLAGEDKPDIGLDPRPVERQSAYRIEIRPDRPDVDAYGERIPVKIGSTLSADIVVERRRLLDWVLDPIRALRGR